MHIYLIRDLLLGGLKKFQTRGYDGAGIATMAPTGKGGMVSFLFPPSFSAFRFVFASMSCG